MQSENCGSMIDITRGQNESETHNGMSEDG